FDFSAKPADEADDVREADATASRRPRLGRGAFRFEHALEHRGLDAATGVRDLDDKRVGAAAELDDDAALDRVLHGVREEVVENAIEYGGFAEDPFGPFAGAE